MAEVRLLFVCLGNICRSPAAEGVFLHLLAREGLEEQFVVDSAGTGGWHVDGPPIPACGPRRSAGGSFCPAGARQIERADLTRFDRILTMDEDNLQAVRALAREGGGSGLLAGEQVARIEPITRHCRRFRSREVPDPYYGGEEGFEHVLDLLEDACSGLLEEIRPAEG